MTFIILVHCFLLRAFIDSNHLHIHVLYITNTLSSTCDQPSATRSVNNLALRYPTTLGVYMNKD
jgi:hypothetical protein